MGQGFPDWNPPEFFTQSLIKHIETGNHQYCRTYGTKYLVESIARNYSVSYERKIDPMTEVIVTPGAVAGLYNAITGFISEGDEVIINEPFYDCYLPQIKFSGGIAIGSPLIPPPKNSNKWNFDFVDLKKKLNEKTRMLIISSPNNPTGKILTMEELELIADILENYPEVILVMDEVYEHMIFDEWTKLPRMAAIPRMWNRTITIHSPGKFFSATGARIGFVIGPKHLIDSVHSLQQYNGFCMYGPMQSALADSLDIAAKPYKGHENYYAWLRNHYTECRDYFTKHLNEIEEFKGKFWIPDGAYFCVVDVSDNILEDHDYSFEGENNKLYKRDYKYLLKMAYEKKVVGIPLSAFYTPENAHIGEHYIRLAFCKKQETMQKAFDNLNNL
jgi:aspartate/methionine/tyrosine aminotransferase